MKEGSRVRVCSTRPLCMTTASGFNWSIITHEPKRGKEGVILALDPTDNVHRVRFPDDECWCAEEWLTEIVACETLYQVDIKTPGGDVCDTVTADASVARERMKALGTALSTVGIALPRFVSLWKLQHSGPLSAPDSVHVTAVSAEGGVSEVDRQAVEYTAPVAPTAELEAIVASVGAASVVRVLRAAGSLVSFWDTRDREGLLHPEFPSHINALRLEVPDARE